MISKKVPLRSFLNNAYIKEMNNYNFYYSISRNDIQNPLVRDLIVEISEAEAGLVDRIEHMMNSDVVEIVNLSFSRDYFASPPNPTPFDPIRAEKEFHIAVCNEVLGMEYETYKFYQTLFNKTNHEELKFFFKQCASLKGEIITRIRDLFETF
ncbi:MAG: hypothetical protein ACTSU3_07465 [Candidatus Thorarchaeota archaeon]